MLRSSADDLQYCYYDSAFQTEGALTLKAFADNAGAITCYYLHRRLASEGIVSLGVTLSRVCVSVTALRISLGGEGNALYPVLSSCDSLLL